jgi:transposase-like protein
MQGIFTPHADEDKQRAVKAALAHPQSAKMSDSAIARHVGVAVSTVSDWREKLSASLGNLKIETRTVTRNGTTYQQDTTNIGRPLAPAPRTDAGSNAGGEGGRGKKKPLVADSSPRVTEGKTRHNFAPAGGQPRTLRKFALNPRRKR